MIEIKIIDEAHKNDINIPNEPFPIYGQMIVERCDGEWTYNEELFSPNNISEMTFPDENYIFEKMKEYTFLGAYCGETCIGPAILCPVFNPCLFLYDLKVNKSMRGKGIGKMLIDEAYKIAKDSGYVGLYTVGQDNNLNACLFYLSCGFVVGGCDTEIYRGTKQEGKSDIIFYKH